MKSPANPIQRIISAATCGAGAISGRLLVSFVAFPAIARAQFAYWSPSAGGNGHYYEAVVSPGINWYNAGNLATNKGGYLATITSSEENAFIFALIKTNPGLWDQRPTGNSWGPWIGGVQPPGSVEPAGGWSWVTGEKFAYSNWSAGEPSNGHGTEDRIHFWGEQAPVGDVWNDRPADDGVQGFVIEYDTHPNAARLNISIHNTDQLQIAWKSRVNVTYSLQCSKGFASANWVTLTNMVGNGGTCLALERLSDTPHFYRVLSTP